MKLKIELVPKKSWGNNLRRDANLKQSQWDKLRKACYASAGYRCEICGGKGNKHPVECHERWSYNDETQVQKLEGLIALCPLCHKAKHLGRTLSLQGENQQLEKMAVLSHIQKVNGLNDMELDAYIKVVFALWSQRSKHPWTLDLSWLSNEPS